MLRTLHQRTGVVTSDSDDLKLEIKCEQFVKEMPLSGLDHSEKKTHLIYKQGGKGQCETRTEKISTGYL